MVRTSLALVVMGVLAATVGCSTCCHPYDRCGPVYTGPYATGCARDVRVGSVFSGTGQMPGTMTYAHHKKSSGSQATQQFSEPQSELRPQPQLVPQPMSQSKPSSDDMPGTEHIISVTERVVPSPALIADGPALSADVADENARAMPIKGWTAKRSTDDTIVR
jgi:hypothetical protein